MPEYKVLSGDLKAKITTPDDADPMTVAVMAILKKSPKMLGMIMSVEDTAKGEDDVLYISTERVLGSMGHNINKKEVKKKKKTTKETSRQELGSEPF